MGGLLVVTPAGPDADALCATLHGRGFEVHQAGTGAGAVDVALRRQPDVILMDPGLSAMDRWHAVKRLNTESATARIPVLTLVSDPASAAGIDRVLAKIERTLGGLPQRSAPTGLAALARAREVGDDGRPALVDVRTPTPEVGPDRGAGPAVALGRVLIVDDNAMNRDMLARRLERRGYRVLTAEDGESALAVVADGGVDLVLLDWMMPGMSGIEVLREIRARYAPVALPVIMATARAEASDVVEALDAEANDYVAKPLNFDVVLARIKTQLALVEANRALVASERRYRTLVENTGDLVVQFRATGEVTYVSPVSRALLGFEPSELLQGSFFDWLHPLDRDALEARMAGQVTSPPAYTFIARVATRDARWLWVEASCRVLRQDGDAMIHAACRDVSEHMERLAGDEPPLPLGGDILAHPGWRGAGPQYSAAPPERPVVVTVVVGQAGHPVQFAELSKMVSDELRKALGEDGDVGV